ncbi:SufB/SufD family protein [Henriciella aquimarina]|uniref:SufB/SufD family protein n=1 Tax=Henriciella aquimarina TaxID=545261 RepID=UPI0009FC7C4A|nr:SufD family Fe-S cluster assembly protein [Henriciella aquimarina]
MTLADLKEQFGDPTPAELQLIAKYGELPEDARRLRAFEAFAKNGLPHRRMEQWKWTDFRHAIHAIETGQPRREKTIEPSDDALVFRFDGKSWHVPQDLPDGLSVFEKSEAQAVGNAEELPLAALAGALTGQSGRADLLQVEVTKPIKQPVFLDFDYERLETAFARIAFVVRPEAKVDVIERHAGGAGFSSVLVEFGIQDGGHVTRSLLQSGGAEEATAITAGVTLGAQAVYEQTALAFGAKVARIETRLAYEGEAGRAHINAAYLPADGYHVDFTSHVRHGAQSCVTRQLTKGAVNDGGRGVFQGKFHVPRSVGQHTDADMQHQAILLENGAEVYAKPELEIYADDVECAHGNTSGQLDETALFYMRQRGIPHMEARALLTEAFIAEALETAHPSVRDSLLEASRAFLRNEA